MPKIEVVCCWGDGPDILVESKDVPMLLMEDPDKKHFTHGTVNYWQLDLTAKQALELAKSLEQQALKVLEIERDLEKYHESEICDDLRSDAETLQLSFPDDLRG